MNVAIITARSGTARKPDKNMYPVAGVPVISYPLRAALEAKLVDEVYISTDAPDIAAYGVSQGAKIIKRPDSLLTGDINHGEVIWHAVQTIDNAVTALENVVVLLGNSVMVNEVVLDTGLRMLDQRPDIDSCMTVWTAGHDHPLRAMELQDGFLHPYKNPNRDISTEMDAYSPAYYFDQGAWIFRKRCVEKRDGPNPWWWMGKKCVPLIRQWIQGRDIHSYFDLAVAEWWVANAEKFPIIFESDGQTL